MQNQQTTEIPGETPHPFDSPSIIAEIRKYAPEYEDKIRTAKRPRVLSENPSDLQRWESTQVLRRKQMDPLREDNFGWLLRTLYEETFLVCADPDKPREMRSNFEGSEGLTTGGLISHYLSRHRINGASVKDIVTYDLNGRSLKEALINEPDYNKRQSILCFAQEQSSDSNFRMFDGISMSKMVQDPTKYRIPSFMNTYGYRLLRLLKNVPELCQQIKEPTLKKVIGYKENTELTIAEFIQLFWHKVGTIPGSPILTDRGGFKQVGDLGVVDGLKTLLEVRTHPELQVIYQYVSPSGHLDKFMMK